MFTENQTDQNKNQDYKKHFKEYTVPEGTSYIEEMYNKQRELQQFLAERGKTQAFPAEIEAVKQPDVQLAIYHLFCAQVELEELKVEMNKIVRYTLDNQCDISQVPEEILISARYELIDMFFFMFNVGIYTGLNMVNIDVLENPEIIIDGMSVYNLEIALMNLLDYIDKLPWKAWKSYNYEEFYTKMDYTAIKVLYYEAIRECIAWSKQAFGETKESLFNLYMNKWEENKRRQLDKSSGYIL